MTLSKLAVKNIKKSIRDYSIYFMTLVIGVIIFYIFNAIETQTVALNVSKSSYEIIDLMNIILSGMSVFVAFVLGGLIIYASRFLIKRRSKEFGVYLTLGMSKKRMSGMLFVETLIIGVVSLVVGLIIGVILSQFMSIVVANLFEADMTQFEFVFSSQAAIKTVAYFGIMYLVVMIFNTLVIGKCKLLNLLQGTKRNEEMKFRNPILCIVLFIISCITLGISYYFVTAGLKNLTGQKDLVIIIIMGAVSTFFIFWSLSGLMMGIFRKMKGVYYKKMNSFILRQFSSKANTMVISMTIVNLMLFFTIVALGSAVSLTRNLNENVRKMLPCDVGYVKKFNVSSEDIDEWYKSMSESEKEAIYKDSQVDIMSTFKTYGFDTGVLKDVLDVYEYSYDGLTLKAFAGEKLGEVTQNYAFIHEDDDMTILRQSDYNKIADLFGNEKVDLAEDEYVVVADFEALFDVINDVLGEGKTIDIKGHVLKPQKKEYLFGVDAFESGHTNTGFFVVSDDVVDDSMRAYDMVFANYAAGSKEEKQQIEEKVKEFSDSVWNQNAKSFLMTTTKEEIRSSSIGLAVMASFVSLYVGIIFLIASAAILSLKELSESADNVEKFAMLRKIGVDEKMINSTLFKQIGLFFLFPMVLACIHSIFGLKFANRMFEIFGTTGLGGSLCITAIIIVAFYGGYFLLTYFSSKRIIRDVTRR
ncbi:MAG: ABC transporter permease [Eubacterium sp.]|nr:ABC transporter permease [Eubacterium sp.]